MPYTIHLTNILQNTPTLPINGLAYEGTYTDTPPISAPYNRKLILLSSKDREDDPPLSNIYTYPYGSQHVWSIPEIMTAQDAWSHLQALFVARDAIYKGINVMTARGTHEMPEERNILVLGGETRSVAAAVQILKFLRGEARIVVVDMSHGEGDLVQRSASTPTPLRERLSSSTLLRRYWIHSAPMPLMAATS